MPQTAVILYIFITNAYELSPAKVIKRPLNKSEISERMKKKQNAVAKSPLRKVSIGNFRGPDKDNKYIMHTGSTYYKKGTPLKTEQLSNSINSYLKDIESFSIKHKGFI